MMIRVLKSSVKVVRHNDGLWKRFGGNALFGGFAGGEAFAALALHLGHAPRTRGAAVEAFADIAAQAFEPRVVQLVARIHEAQLEPRPTPQHFPLAAGAAVLASTPIPQRPPPRRHLHRPST